MMRSVKRAPRKSLRPASAAPCGSVPVTTMSDTRLTTAQLAYFNAFGFLHFPGLLADSANRIIEEFEAVWAGHGGGGCTR